MDNQELKERFIELYQKYLGLVFRVGLMIMLLVLWDELYWDLRSSMSYGEPSEQLMRFFRRFTSSAEPLVWFLSVSYVLFWFVKKDK